MKSIAIRPPSTFLVASVFFLCLSAMGQDSLDTKAAKQACGPEDIRFDKSAGLDEHPTLGDVPQGKALVYLVQVDGVPNIGALQVMARGAITKFGVDGEWKGATWGNSFIATEVEPGNHHLCVAWNNGGPKKLEQGIALHSLHAEAGHTYVYGVQILAGGTLRYEFLPLDPDEAALLLQSYPRSKLKPKP